MRFLRWINSQTQYLGQQIKVPIFFKKSWSVCWAMSEKEVTYLITYLLQRKFIESVGASGTADYTLTILPAGFSYLDEIDKNVQSNVGFCAMSFSSDLLAAWENAIYPAINDSGYNPVRIDSEAYNTGVVDQIKAKIRLSKFIVADLTLHRQGVYYEAGFAEGLGRPVIFTCREDDFKNVHFDVQHINTILWNINDYENFKKTLRWRIESTLGRGKT